MKKSSKASLKNSVIIIDGYSILFRAYYALPEMTSHDGVTVSAIQGFFNILFKVLNDIGATEDIMPAPVIVALDSGIKETFRHKLCDEYKLKRIKAPESLSHQINLLPEFLEAFGISFIKGNGYEADDYIASYAKMAEADLKDVIIVTSDKDLLQLVNDSIRVFDHRKSLFLNSDDIYKKFNVRPEQIGAYLALIGDASDNIPGVRGIGPKAAVKVLSEYEDIQEIYDQPERLSKIVSEKVKSTIIDGKEDAELSMLLVSLVKDIPSLPELRNSMWGGLVENKESILAILKKYDMEQLAARVRKKILSLSEGIKSLPLGGSESDFILKSFVDTCKREGILSISLSDTEMSCNYSLSFMPAGEELESGRPKKELFLFSSQDAIKIEFFLLSELPDVLLELIQSKNMRKVTTNYSQVCHYLGIQGDESWDDLNVMHYSMSTRTSETVGKGSGERYRLLLEDIKRSGARYDDVDKPLNDLLISMEDRGIKVDVEYLERLDENFASDQSLLEKKIYAEADKEFNLSSPAQVSEVLFGKMMLHKSLSGYSATSSKRPDTSAKTLEELASHGFTICEDILEWRRISKLRNTYIASLLNLQRGGRVHCTFHSHLTLTGRLSTSNPNLQSIPVKRKEGKLVRNAFIADDGNVLLSADYSQIEMRVLAHIANCKALVDMFSSGMDIHSITAAEVFGVPYESVDESLRRKAKAINFGIVYGISPFGLANNIGVSTYKASEYIKRYFSIYKGIEEYMESAIESARSFGYVSTFLGRKCYINNINHTSHMMRRAAERVAINSPIQGGAADIIRLAMVKLNKTNKDSLLLQIHDELVFEVPEEEVELRKKEVIACMEGAIELILPLEVKAKSGKRYS